MPELPVVVVGSPSPHNERVTAALERRGFPVELVDIDRVDPAVALGKEAELFVVVLPSQLSGAELLAVLTAQRNTPPVIVVGCDDTVTGAADAFARGARDFIESSEETNRLLEAIGLALGTSRRDSQLRFFRQREATSADWARVVGKCDAMEKTLALVQQIVRRTLTGKPPPILITGETGTGKGLIARCIHYNSARRNEPLVDVNCAAIPPNLIESELFGHERGAFTDARTSRPGLFETANNGSLFLDEIGTLPTDLQAKLLVATEEQRVRRIGARQSRSVNVQLIAATHSDLAEKVQTGQFREDLYHRLNVLAVHLPPLRERATDKLLLAERFAAQMATEYGIAPRPFSEDARRAIVRYAWPGNVRELKNQIERIFLLENDDVIRAEHFHFADSPELRLAPSSDRLEIKLPKAGISLQQLEIEVLRAALMECEGNVSRAARFLKISRQTLIYRMKKHGLSAPE